MPNYNKAILMGNLTRDPEVRYAQSGSAVVNFGLAINEKWSSDGQNQERTTFVDVTMFGKRGEAFAKYHAKGKPAFVEGRLRLDEWEKDGQKRTKLYVVADTWEFLPKGERSSAGVVHEKSARASMPETPF